jgi:hypothetical protein
VRGCAPDPIAETKKNKNPAEKKKKINLSGKSSLLLPEQSCEQLSYCTTSMILNCFAVRISANSIKQPNDCKDDGQLQQQDDGHLQQQTPW